MLFSAIVDPDSKQFIIIPNNKEMEDYSSSDGSFMLMKEAREWKNILEYQDAWYNDYQVRIAGGYLDARAHLGIMADYEYKMYVRNERWMCMNPIDLLKQEIRHDPRRNHR